MDWHTTAQPGNITSIRPDDGRPYYQGLLAMALSQFVHETMTFRYVLRTDRAARAPHRFGALLSKPGHHGME